MTDSEVKAKYTYSRTRGGVSTVVCTMRKDGHVATYRAAGSGEVVGLRAARAQARAGAALALEVLLEEES